MWQHWVKYSIEYLKERHVFNANCFCAVKLQKEGGGLPFSSKTTVISEEVKEENSFENVSTKEN